MAPSEITRSGIGWAASWTRIDPSAMSGCRYCRRVSVLPVGKSAYYREYGRALARLPKRQTEAVLMLRRAEKISPARIHWHPFMRAVLTELLARAKEDADGRL